MILFVFGPLVVVAANVEVGKSRLHVCPGLARMVPCVTDGRGHFASRVELVGESGECLADLNTARFGAFVNFVADAPEKDAWMIAVAQNHAFKIALPPLLEVEVI